MGCFSPLAKTIGTVGMILSLTGCSVVMNPKSTDKPTAAPPSTSPPVTATVKPANPTASPASTSPVATQSSTPEQNYYHEGVNRASSAVAIGQSAQSQDDWTLAASRWQQALDLLQKVPTDSPDYAQAQTKITEYRNHLTSAQQRVDGKPTPLAQATPSRPDGLVAQIPIIERHGGTPVVSVNMQGQKGSKTFPMMFDTGATGTLITQEMANALGVVVISETQARIADGSIVTLPIGYVDAIEVGGLRKEAVLVAIGGSVGLLGQDIYGEFGIAMGSHVINLHQ